MTETAKMKPVSVKAPMQAVVHQLNIAVGDVVAAQAELVVLEAMKMHHGLTAPIGGRVTDITIVLGDVVDADQVLVRLEPVAQADETQRAETETDPDLVPGVS